MLRFLGVRIFVFAKAGSVTLSAGGAERVARLAWRVRWGGCGWYGYDGERTEFHAQRGRAGRKCPLFGRVVSFAAFFARLSGQDGGGAVKACDAPRALFSCDP